MEYDGRQTHLQSDDTGHGIRDGTDRRYAEIGFDRDGDAQGHNQKAEHVE